MADLVGSIFSSISGMKGNTTGIAISSDNLVNLNVVGYKANETLFSTLVTTFGTSGVYSNGGLLARTQQNVSRSGSIISTSNPMDIAVEEGKGMIPINSQVNGLGDVLYTRRGDFKQDKDGNYVNGAGNVLMAWPLDVEGRLPGEKGNLNTTPNSLLSSLVPVNTKNIVGSATATTNVVIGGNLNEQTPIAQGVGGMIKLPSSNSLNSINNLSIGASQVIVPEAISPSCSIEIGDTINIALANSGETYSYSFGGMTPSNAIGRGSPMFGAVNFNDIFTSGITEGQSFNVNLTSVSSQSSSFAFTYKTVQPNPALGQFNSLASLSIAMNNAISNNNTQALTSRFVNGQLWLAPVDGAEGISFVDGSGSNIVSSLGFLATAPQANRFSTLAGLKNLINESPGLAASLDQTSLEGIVDFNAVDPTTQMTITATSLQKLPTFSTTGNISSNTLIVNLPNSNLQVGQFVGISGTGYPVSRGSTSSFSLDGIPFGDGAYEVASVTPYNFSIIVENGESSPVVTPFNAITSLIQTNNVINANGFSSSPGSNIVTIHQNLHGFTTGTIVYFSNITTAPFNNLTLNPNTGYSITVLDANTYQVTASGAGSGGSAGTPGIAPYYGPYQPVFSSGSFGIVKTLSTAPDKVVNMNLITSFPSMNILQELGLDSSGLPEGPAYDPTGINAGNMTDAAVSPQFSMNGQVFDSFGESHNITIGYLKTSINSWAVEIWINDPTQVTGAQAAANGQLASGTISFNGDGTLQGVTTSLLNPVTINWANQSLPSSIAFNWGTAGLPAIAKGGSIGGSDGLSQFASDFSKRFVNANGYAPSNLQNIDIDPDGYIVANFSTGGVQKIFKVPLIEFANPDGLEAVSGNAYAETYKSGPHNLRFAGANIGTFAGNSLEKSTSDMSDELNNILVYQKSYQSEAKLVTIASELLDSLINNIT